MDNLIHNLNKNQDSGEISYINFFIFVAIAVLLGITLGLTLTKISQKIKTGTAENITQTKKTIGIIDKKTFKDHAEGILKEGGIDGEGTFHLERPGGQSQNVYLTSSTVDLSQYIGKKVKVWGATFSAEKAGWLMDVGLVEILK